MTETTARLDALYHRVLVTGSQLWADPDPVRADLAAIRDGLPAGTVMVVVQGRCEKGPDAFARAWAIGCEGDGHPVDVAYEDWPGTPGQYTVRNHRMVNSLPTEGLAYNLDGSTGTSRTAEFARQARIPMTIRTRYSRPPRHIGHAAA